MSDNLEKAANIIRDQKLTGMQAMQVLDKVAGKPDFKKLIEDRMKCVCGKELPVSAFPIVDTGVTKAVYNVCPSCLKEASELAHLCCTSCKTIVGHVYPHKEPAGFEFKKNAYYHISCCPQCSDREKGRADVIEKVLFFRMNNIPMKHDPEFD